MSDDTDDDRAAGIRVSIEDGILHLVIDRPDRRNSLPPDGVLRLIAALEEASTDDSLRAVLLRGSGGNFCSGADWVARNADGGEKPRTGSIQRRTPIQAHRLIWLVNEIQLPVVSSVRGWAAGLGCQLALASDFVVAADDSTFWLPFVERGFTPDSGASWMISRLVGVARAKEMLMLGRKVTGREAADWGMIHRAVADDEVDEAAQALAVELAGGPTVALGLTKRLVNRALTGGVHDAMEAEAQALELSSRSKDFREGLAAFSERRPPDFTGR